MNYMHKRHTQFSPGTVALFSGILLIMVVSLIQYRSSKEIQNVSAASTDVIAFEAENGTRTGPQQVIINDPTASNGMYVRFNNATTPFITNTPVPNGGGGGGGAAIYPAQVLNLTSWKITMPFDGSDSGTTADEVKQPALATYKDPNYFFVSPAGNSVIFKAHAGGATTGGSDYARSELREMTSNGSTEAGWSSASGKHTLTIDQRINKLPTKRPNIIVGQIHAGSTWGTVFRLIGTQLMIDGVDGDGPIVDSDLQLGERFTVKFEVENDTVKYYYNNNLINYTYSKQFRGAYFKAGSYIQSSCQGAGKVEGESCDAYGEVEIYNVQVTHN
ncbi:polysaccharide lyase family 7 protein [Candidatus Saccharibacteria bacterium]|nr:polysaccharide lyase family 7 protein [Candidatus Saccharibacteria bacterium]